MSVGTVGRAVTPLSVKLRSGLKDVLAGGISSALSISYSLSYAALIFSGPLANQFSYGIALSFISVAIAALIMACRSSFAFAIAGPDSSTSAVMATLVAAFTAHLVVEGRPDMLGPSLIVMAIGTGLTGLLLCVLGFTQAGRAIRFVPFPVIGGFLGASGWLMVIGAIQVITGRPVSLAEFVSASISMADVAKVGAALGVAVALQIMITRWPNPLVLPGVLVAAIVATHLVVSLTGTPLAAAQAAGWLFQPQPAAVLTLPWNIGQLHRFPWADLPWLSGEILAVMFVTLISLLLNTTGIEISSRHEADLRRELKVLGLANLAIAAFGGFVSCLSLSRTTLNRAAGATGRVSGVTLAAISAGMLVVDPRFLGYVPKFALGSLLLFAGGRLAYHWLIRSFRRLPTVDFVSLLAIVLVIVQWGFVAGVLVGIVIGCLTFALSASRVNTIRFSFDGSEYRSSLDRGVDELAILARHGADIQGLALQSYLFFGSANRLYEHVKSVLKAHPTCRFLVFDFWLVTGMDSSALNSFSQLKNAASERGTTIVLVNLRADMAKTFGAAGFITDDVVVMESLDRALESCEKAIIEAHRVEASEGRSLCAWLAQAFHSPELAECLAGYCCRFEVQPGDIIARQGEPADSMHFLLEGRVGIVVTMDDGRSLRVRSLGRHTTIGEMGLIAARNRSATIQAEMPSVLYELSADAYAKIMKLHPDLGQALLSYVVAIMSDRLAFANRAVGVLQR